MTDHPDSPASYSALLELMLQLRMELAAVRAENVALRDEIRRLKGLPPRPPVKPSGMEQSSKQRSAGQGNKGARFEPGDRYRRASALF
jgi:hypothetical protein